MEEVKVKGTVTGYRVSLAGTQQWVRVKIGESEIWVREEDIEREPGREERGAPAEGWNRIRPSAGVPYRPDHDLLRFV